MPTSDAVDVGSKVAKYRTARGLNQRALAPMIGITQGQLSRLEAGLVGWSVATLVLVSKALSVPISALLPAADDLDLGICRLPLVP